MKTKRFRILAQTFFVGAVISMFTFTSCDKDDDVVVEDPIASYQYEISESNPFEVAFTNYSQNATSYAWEFGDDEISAEENPTHLFAVEGTYTVKLTVTNTDGVTDDVSKDITIIENAQALLTGGTSKKWMLVREGTVGGIGPAYPNYWEYYYLENNGARPCMFNQSWTFNDDGTVVFDDGGYMWGESDLFASDNANFETCVPKANWTVNKDGDDITPFLGGTHDFTYDPSAGTLALNGTGAWMGIVKITESGYVITPQSSVTYDVTIAEGDVCDTMYVGVTPAEGNYWQYNYVSYHDWANQPDVVSFRVSFDVAVEDYTVTFTNTSADAVSYSWDFGDGSTSTDENPTHTYAEEGTYEVVLTGTNASGDTKEATKTVSISLNPTELAPDPTEDEANVISIYSDAYTDIDGVNLDPAWGQGTVTEEVEVQSEMILKMGGLDYQGIAFDDNAQNVSGKTKVHLDIYCTAATDIFVSLIGGGAENAVTVTTEAGAWKSFDIDLSEYTSPDLTAIHQLKFEDGSEVTPTIFVDNIYFY